MSTIICSCGDPQFANTGRPDCVIEMKALSFPILVPRFKANGQRNTIDTQSATIGSQILAKLQTGTPVLERFYPIPRAENVSFERSETVYETAPSGRKVKIDGVGGVRTMRFELWSKEAVHQILRELKKIGCTDVDVYLVDVAGNLWGIKDNPGDQFMRGYEMATETFDAFKEYATDTTTQKIMLSFDLDNAECEENSYAITPGELGYKATTLTGLISASQVAIELTNVQMQTTVSTGFGSAVTLGKVKGLTLANFIVTGSVSGAVAISGVTETADGVYALDHLDPAVAPGETITIQVGNATGYDVSNGSFVATL